MANDKFRDSPGDESLLERAVRPRLKLRDVDDSKRLYDGVGAELNAARRRQGFDIPAVGSELRILNRYIEAIEEGRFGDLPGDVYVLGFLRSYAELLNLNPEVVLEQYKVETAAPRPETVLDFPSPRDRGRLPSAKLLVVVGLFLVFLYAGWFAVTNEERLTSAIVSPLPDRFNLAAGNTTSSAAQSDAEARAAKSDTVLAKKNTAVAPAAQASSRALSTNNAALIETGVGEQDQADGLVPNSNEKETQESSNVLDKQDDEETAQTPVQISAEEYEADRESPLEEKQVLRKLDGNASEGSTLVVSSGEGLSDEQDVKELAPGRVEVASTSPPSTGDEENLLESSGSVEPFDKRLARLGAQSRVVIFAKADSWIQVKKKSGDILMSGLLRAGDNYAVPDRRDVVLMTGNAGALVIFVDGAPISELGGGGDIVRNISLDPELLGLED